MSFVFDPDNPLKQPIIRLSTVLEFPQEDKNRYKWLEKNDRFYRVTKPVGSGSYASAFIGYACDENGTVLLGARKLVIKIPRLDWRRTKNERKDRTREIRDKVINEWDLIRAKLRKCRQANSIFDIGQLDPDRKHNYLDLWVTVQPYLSSAREMRDWMADKGQRTEPVFDKKTNLEEAWGGACWKDWLKMSTMVGESLAEIHRRRVVHGDIWPPNIYISTVKGPKEPIAIFIDFGESFEATDVDEAHLQGDHPYRAPERKGTEYIATEQVDVYSFGKLMLYLFLGVSGPALFIPSVKDKRPLFGHQRRAFIRDMMVKGPGRAAELREHPEILDVISQCTQLDPVIRPTMLEVCDQLHAMALDPLKPLGKGRIGPGTGAHLDLARRLKRVASKKGALDQLDPVFLQAAERKIVELERMIEGCKTDMVEIAGTRDSLIASLVALFRKLSRGDSWTTLTSPSVWQKDGLGLDGRYLTAMIHALRRGAAIHRTFTVSIEELGVEWSTILEKTLRATGRANFESLSATLRARVHAFNSELVENSQKKPEERTVFVRDAAFVEIHQQRFALVVESLAIAAKLFDLNKHIYKGKFRGIKKTHGLYLGLVPQSTLADVRKQRTQKMPASLMRIAPSRGTHEDWLLVVTDIRGRNENEPLSRLGLRGRGQMADAPQLRQVRVYRSKLTVPEKRIADLDELMVRSVNIGSDIELFAKCVEAACIETRKLRSK